MTMLLIVMTRSSFCDSDDHFYDNYFDNNSNDDVGCGHGGYHGVVDGGGYEGGGYHGGDDVKNFDSECIGE